MVKARVVELSAGLWDAAENYRPAVSNGNVLTDHHGEPNRQSAIGNHFIASAKTFWAAATPAPGASLKPCPIRVISNAANTPRVSKAST